MNQILEQQYEAIRAAVLAADTTDPLALVRQVMRSEGIAVNGPAHHFLSGAAFLAAFRSAGGKLDLPRALDTLAHHAVRMPEGMCDSFGVCGAVTSVSAAMAIIHKTVPGSDTERFRTHTQYTARALTELSRLGGPRCCKRNVYLAITLGVHFLNETYGTALTLSTAPCPFSAETPHCIGAKCPFFAAGL